MPCCLAVLVFLLASAPRASSPLSRWSRRKLLVPLAARENARSSYSRARPPAAERRVRMLDAARSRTRKAAPSSALPSTRVTAAEQADGKRT